MGRHDPLLVDPPDSLECPLRAVASGGVVDYPTMTLGNPGQETGPAASEPRASPRSSRSTTRAFGGSLPPAEHVARVIWDFAKGLNLGPLYAEIKSVEGHAGRPASDPRVYLALWMLAVVEGVGSARKVAELCERHDAYRWLCGGVPGNYHTLADFRVGHGEDRKSGV